MSRWQLDFRQIESGEMETLANIRPGGIVTLLEMTMSRGVHQVGAAPRDTISFGIPLSEARYRWRGRDIQGQSLVCFGNGHEFDANCTTAFDAVTLSISVSAWERLADQIGLPVAITDRVHEPTTMVGPGREGGFRLVGLRARAFIREPTLPFGRAEQEGLILDLLRAVHSGGTFRDHSSKKLRSRALDNALQIMALNTNENLPVSTLCAEAGASWSTLDRAFKERFGLGPKAYLTRLRLGRVREELCNSPPEVPIVEVANAFGFWHMGQFAKDYRAMFGELPSDARRS